MRFKKIFFTILAIFFLLTSNSSAKIIGKKIVFGSTVSLSGKYSSEAISIKKNHKIFIEKINQSNGIKISGKLYKFEIIYYDNESNETRANQLLKRLIQNDGVQYLISPHNLKLSDEVENLIKINKLAISPSYDAIKIYIDAFKSTDSIESRKIREYILNNK